MSRAVNEILGNIQTQRERIRETQERLRRRELIEAELRRPGAPTPPRRAGAIRATDTEGSGAREGVVSRLAGNTSNTLSNAWDSLEALYNVSLESSQYEQTLQRIDTGTNTGDRATFLGSIINQIPLREWDDDLSSMRLRAYGSGSVVPQPDETAGLVWSEDGRKL